MLKLVVYLSALLAVFAAARLEEKDVSDYGFKYAVKDPHTHDRKSHWQAQEAGKVRGAYKLVEPDGSLRTVEYTADGRNGFNAVVTREKHGHRQVTYHGKRQDLVRKPLQSDRRHVYHSAVANTNRI